MWRRQNLCDVNTICQAIISMSTTNHKLEVSFTKYGISAVENHDVACHAKLPLQEIGLLRFPFPTKRLGNLISDKQHLLKHRDGQVMLARHGCEVPFCSILSPKPDTTDLDSNTQIHLVSEGC